MLRKPVKFAGFLFCVAGYLSHVGLKNLKHARSDRWKLVNSLAPVQQFWGSLALKLFNVKVDLKGDLEALEGPQGFLVVANHLSYIDILIVNKFFPSCFVTSVEMKETPGLGHLCRAAGCLFVERRDKSNIHNEIKDITEALASGLNVVVFPEATSTNGAEVLRFRRPLYNAAIDSSKKVKPLCLNYRFWDGEELTVDNRDNIFWYDNMPFVSHLWNMGKAKDIHVELQVLDDVHPEEPVDAAHLAEKTHSMVREVYQPIL